MAVKAKLSTIATLACSSSSTRRRVVLARRFECVQVRRHRVLGPTTPQSTILGMCVLRQHMVQYTTILGVSDLCPNQSSDMH